jgi:predicted nuclease of predicted toxin-antitoxin system
MRILLDQGVGRSAAERLRAEGFAASHVADHGLSRALDQEILAFALESADVVVTFDHDFHEHLALSGARAPSVIFVRDDHLKSAELAELVAALCRRHEDSLLAGAAVTVRRGLARIRLLPLRRVE